MAANKVVQIAKLKIYKVTNTVSNPTVIECLL